MVAIYCSKDGGWDSFLSEKKKTIAVSANVTGEIVDQGVVILDIDQKT